MTTSETPHPVRQPVLGDVLGHVPSGSDRQAGEQADLLESLRHHRGLLRRTLRGLDDDQARERTTVSDLTLGGLVKHVADTEKEWAEFIQHGAIEQMELDWEAIDWSNPTPEAQAFLDGHRMTADESLADLLTAYDEVAARTDALVAGLDLDSRQPLPSAPWFAPGETWSARRVLLHVIAETAQHAGHADIIRESLDGQKTMG